MNKWIGIIGLAITLSGALGVGVRFLIEYGRTQEAASRHDVLTDERLRVLEDIVYREHPEYAAEVLAASYPKGGR